MKSVVCPECLSRDGVLIVVTVGQACERCGEVPSVTLTPRLIRDCLHASYQAAKARPTP